MLYTIEVPDDFYSRRARLSKDRGILVGLRILIEEAGKDLSEETRDSVRDDFIEAIDSNIAYLEDCWGRYLNTEVYDMAMKDLTL